MIPRLSLAIASLALLLAACSGGGRRLAAALRQAPRPRPRPCPTTQPAPLGADQTRTVTLATEKGNIVIGIKGALSPIAAGNFVALAECGYYDGTVFHRTAALQDGTPFVIQGGDPTGTGTGGPGYTIKDEPVTTPYHRGTVAMARTAEPDSVGSQFFIVLDDAGGRPAVRRQHLPDHRRGDLRDGGRRPIFVASGGKELPANPVAITTATVANP